MAYLLHGRNSGLEQVFYANLSILVAVFLILISIILQPDIVREDWRAFRSSMVQFFYWTGNRALAGSDGYARCLEGWKDSTDLNYLTLIETNKVTRGGSIRCVKE